MKRVNNRYCTTCLRTRQFHEVGDHYICERCRKMLFKVQSRVVGASGR